MTKAGEGVGALEPREVFSHFAAVSGIPRGSGNEKGISDFLVAFARARDLEVIQDKAMNVLIRKPGTPGHERAPVVTLQAHMDMVCAKDKDRAFDFATDPLKLRVDGDRLRATGTTLGADNGVGMAYMLALLDSSDIPHPPLEALFTTAEETGMYGAAAFDLSLLKGEYFINVDSDGEGVFCSSCAGGVTVGISLPIARAAAAPLRKSGFDKFRIEVRGLRGGHSGVEIDKGRGNSNRLMGRVLQDLADKYDIHACFLMGGQAHNAIPVRTTAGVMFRKADLHEIHRRLGELQKMFRNELKGADGKPDASGTAHNVRVELSPALPEETVFSAETLRKFLFAANVIPTGVAAMDMNMEEGALVETSSNFATVRTGGEALDLTVSVRSSLASKKDFLVRQLTLIATSIGATVTTGAEYPSWEFDPDSRLRTIFQEAYGQVYPGRTARVEGIHAGLECGLFSAYFKRHRRRVDFISLGPDIRDAHTPAESVGIASVGRVWELLKAALEIISGERATRRISQRLRSVGK